MSYETEVDELSTLGTRKVRAFQSDRRKLIVGGMQAGAYVGIAIILIMTLGAQAPESVRALIMGGAFGLALILVVIGGAELFTGYNLYTAVAVRQGKITLTDAVAVNAQVFAANLAGAALLVLVYRLGQGALTSGGAADFLQSASAKKMHLPVLALIARGALCNWLVCLALWMARRVDSDAARCIVIGWCLLAFIAAGFEHSVANMTVHLLALAGPENAAVSITGAIYNLTWVTLGNVIGGAIFVGLAYCAQTKSICTVDPKVAPVTSPVTPPKT